MAAEGAVSFSKIRQIAVPVTDIDEATRFYRDVLGMRHLFDAPPQLSFFDCGGVQLMLSGPEGGGKEADQQRPVIYYDVADIKAIHAQLTAAGAATIQAPHMIARMGGREIWIGFISDGQGNMVGLMSDVPQS
jgi:methylmalonyl-CoA/ethylmalonyl-CoA epimerase